MELLIGFVLVILAGLGTGTAAWPLKKIKEFRFEQYLFVFAFTGLIFFPWLVVLFNVPDLHSVIAGVGIKPLLIHEHPDTFEEMILLAESTLLKRGFVKSGDKILFLAGIPAHQAGGTNFVKIHTVIGE